MGETGRQEEGWGGRQCQRDADGRDEVGQRGSDR